MKKALRCLLMLATMAVLFVLPSAMANDSISATLNDADNLSLDRPAVVLVNFKATGSESKPTVTLKTDGKSALFDNADSVTMPAEKLSDGSYRVRAIATLCETSGTIEISTSDGQKTSVSFTAKEEADDGLPVLTTGNSSSGDTSAAQTKDEDNSAKDDDANDASKDKNDDSQEYDTDRTLVIYAGTANTSVPTNRNVGFSAVLLDSLGKVVSMGGGEEWQWSVTLNGEDIDFTETSSHAINVKPTEDGELVVGCVISLGDKQYQAENLTLQVSPEDAALESIAIESDQTSVTAGDQVTLTRTINPDYCTDLEGAEVEWKAVQNDETIALGSGSSFTFRPDDPGDVAVSLTITPSGKDPVVSNTVTVKVTAEPDDTTLKSVSIKADSQTDDVRVGDTLTLSAVTNPDDAEDVSYTWSVIDKDNQETILASHKDTIDLELDEVGQMNVCLSARQDGVKVQADKLALNVTEAAADDSNSGKEAEDNNTAVQDPADKDDNDAALTDDKNDMDNPTTVDDDKTTDPADQNQSDDSDASVNGGVQNTDDDSNAGGDAQKNTDTANNGATSVSVLATYQTTKSGGSNDSGSTGGSTATTLSSGSTTSSSAKVDSTQPSTGNEDLNATAKVMASVMILGVSCLLIYAVRRSRQHEIHYL